MADLSQGMLQEARRLNPDIEFRREDGFDGGCASVPAAPRVAAVVNLYGPADLGALLLNSPSAGFTSDWLGTDASGADAVRRLSPASLASPGSPPILTVQGSADDLVPEGATRRFHARLDSLGVRNRLVVLPGAGHTFSPGEEARARDEARRFLMEVGAFPGSR